MQTLLKLYNTYPNSAPYAALLDATAQSAVAGSKRSIDAGRGLRGDGDVSDDATSPRACRCWPR